MASYAEQVAATRDRITRMLEAATQPTGWERVQSGLSGTFGTGEFQKQLTARQAPDAQIERQGILMQLLRDAQNEEAAGQQAQAQQTQREWQRGMDERRFGLDEQRASFDQARSATETGISRGRLDLDRDKFDFDRISAAAKLGTDEEKEFFEFIERITPDRKVAAEVFRMLEEAPVDYDPVTARREAQRLATEIANRPVPVDEKDIFLREGQLRDDYRTDSKEFVVVRDAYNTIKAAATIANPTGPSDMLLIFGFMKLMDPTSGVKEGEYANAENATSIPGWIRNQYNQAIDGVLLNPQQRTDFLQSAKLRYDIANTAQGTRNTQWSNIATGQGINPKNVTLYQQDDIMGDVPGQPGSPAPPGMPPLPQTTGAQPEWRSLTPAIAGILDEATVRGFFSNANAMALVQDDAAFEVLRLRGQAMGIFAGAKVVK